MQDLDRGRLGRLDAVLAGTREFEILRPSSNWTVALAPLPDGVPEHPDVRDAGLVFCEGAERATGGSAARRHSASDVATLALEAPHRLAELDGDFTFVAFGHDGQAIAVRSCGGLVPVYHWSDGQRVAIGTRLDYFLRFLPTPPELDRLVNGIWVTGWALLPDGRTFLEGVSLLDRGRYLRVGIDGRLGVGAYWDPRPAIGQQLRCDPERPRQLRRLLVDTLTRDLDPGGMNLLTLSGGVDSASLGALAVGTLGIPLAALTFLPPDPDGRRRDERYVDILASQCRFQPHWRRRLGIEERIELLRRRNVACFQVPHPVLAVLPELVEEHPIRVLVGGEFADEVVGTFALLADWARHTSVLGLLRGGPSSWPTGTTRDLARWGKHRLLRALRRVRLPFPDQLPQIVQAELHDEYAEWHDRQHSFALADRRPLRQLALSTSQDPFVVMNWEATSPLGVRRSLPFFNREILELAFACHPQEQIGPGTKKLLRAALHDDVPAENLRREDKGTSPSKAVQLPWTEALDEQLARIVRPDWFPRPPALLEQSDAWRLALLAQIAESRHDAVAARPRGIALT